MKKNNILISFVICFLLNGLLHATNCYVLGSANPELADGTEEHPHITVGACVDALGGNNGAQDDTIYIGAGHYEANNLSTGLINIVGSGVNVTKIYSFGQTCFASFGGTIRDLSFDEYEYFSDGSTQTARCYGCISVTSGIGSSSRPVLIYNVLFKEHSSNNIRINSSYVEIRNNVFIDNASIDFNNYSHITIMNNLMIGDIGFSNMNYSTSHKFHNNLFLNNCGIQSFNQSTYNLVYSGSYVAYNGYGYGISDNSCGQMGEFQETDDFDTFSDLNFLVDTWNIYNIYASGENDILFDKGNPDTEFNDQDGSRSDIGVMGGLYPWPFSSGPIITDFNVDPINVQIDGQINVNSRARTE